MITGSWKRYFDTLDYELQYIVKHELQEGLDCGCFSVEDLELWELDDFILFVEDVRCF